MFQEAIMTRFTNGIWLMAIGSLHQLVGAAGGFGLLAMPGAQARNLFADIVRDGLVAAIATDPTRSVLFWYLFFGWLLLLCGWLLHQLERRGEPAPRAIGWQLGALALAGGVLIPASGFWLALPVAWRILRTPGSRTAQNGSLAVMGANEDAP